MLGLSVIRVIESWSKTNKLFSHLVDGLVTVADPTVSCSQVHGCAPVMAFLIDFDLVSCVKMLQHFLVTVHSRAVEWGIILQSRKMIDKFKTLNIINYLTFLVIM